MMEMRRLKIWKEIKPKRGGNRYETARRREKIKMNRKKRMKKMKNLFTLLFLTIYV
jgi:hypothetical protein